MQQQQLANLLGITRHRLGRWENDGVPDAERKLLLLAMREIQRADNSKQSF